MENVEETLQSIDSTLKRIEKLLINKNATQVSVKTQKGISLTDLQEAVSEHQIPTIALKQSEQKQRQQCLFQKK